MDLHARQSRFGIGSVCTGTHRVAAARVVIIIVALLNNTIDPASAIATVRINSPRLQNRILSSVSHPAYPAPVPSGAPTIGSGGLLSWPLMPTLNGWDQHSNTILVCGHQCCRCEDRNTKVICSRTSLRDCNTQDLLLGIADTTNDWLHRLPTEAKTITIEGYRDVRIRRESQLDNCKQLTSLVIRDVVELTVEPLSLSQPLQCTTDKNIAVSLTALIERCKIGQLAQNSFTGRWSNITIRNCHLNEMETESFHQLTCLKTLTLENNIIIGDVKRNTFLGLQVQYLNVRGNTIGSIENHGFDLNVIENAIVQGNALRDIQSESFVFQSPRVFKFVNNTVGTVYQHAFQLTARIRVDIELNTFGHLMRHVLHHARIGEGAKFTIRNNTIDKFEKDALELNETLTVASLQVSQIHLQMNCSCDLLTLVNNTLATAELQQQSNTNDGTSVRSVLIEAVTCRDQTDGSVKGIITFNSLSNCRRRHDKPENRPGHQNNIKPNNNDDQQQMSASQVVGLCIGLLVVIIATAVAALFFIRRQRQKRHNERKELAKANLKQSQSKENLGAWMIAVPETRIYKESEVRLEEEFVMPLEVMTVQSNNA